MISHGDVKWWIANRWILPSDGASDTVHKTKKEVDLIL